MTNKAEYEIENIKKCILEKYNLVLMISKNERHLNKIKKHAEAKLSKNELKMVFFITPDKVSKYLNYITSPRPKTEVVRGFRVTTEYEQDSDNSYTSIRKNIVNLLMKKRNT